jgi:hypothetical protein
MPRTQAFPRRPGRPVASGPGIIRNCSRHRQFTTRGPVRH